MFEPCSPFILVCRSNSCVLKTTYNSNNNNDLFPFCNYYFKLVSRVYFVKCSNLFLLLGFNEGHNIIMFPIGLSWFLWVQFNAYWIKILKFFPLIALFFCQFFNIDLWICTQAYVNDHALVCFAIWKSLKNQECVIN
jgi:hypothetical protein